jgi:hypothetical protein
VSPERPYLILTPHIPNVKLNILIRDGLDVKPHGRDSSHILVELELVQDGCFARCVETQHEKAHFLGSEDLAHHFGDLSSHCGGGVIDSEEEPRW